MPARSGLSWREEGAVLSLPWVDICRRRRLCRVALRQEECHLCCPGHLRLALIGGIIRGAQRFRYPLPLANIPDSVVSGDLQG
ncbi:hypothetical protein [Candidatus Accumulibacter sp. ACC007]|uniref:hypothetical protein n=1 Tax=Candidatus Accumulibacter sp. ACC007 TaxID=2823333 RepID=UPI0025C28DCF|nr:hypothetical protein [Candidatus Accumulibacter sp. ACC007]